MAGTRSLQLCAVSCLVRATRARRRAVCTAYPQVCAEWRSGRVKGEAGARYLSFPPMKSSPDDEIFCAPIATSLRERMRSIYGAYVAVFVKASGAICVRERGGRWRGVAPCDGGAHAHDAGDAIVHDEPASDVRSTHVLNVLDVLGGLPAVNGPDLRCPSLCDRPMPMRATRCGGRLHVPSEAVLCALGQRRLWVGERSGRAGLVLVAM